jgi:hypothetical protein
LHASRTAAGGTKKAASGLRILCGVLCVSACDKKGSIKHAGLWIMTEEKSGAWLEKATPVCGFHSEFFCVSACDKKESIKHAGLWIMTEEKSGAWLEKATPVCGFHAEFFVYRHATKKNLSNAPIFIHRPAKTRSGSGLK